MAPTEAAGVRQLATHVVTEHATEVDAEVPEGMVQVKLDAESEWLTVTPAEAQALHDRVHGSARPGDDQ